MRVYYNVGSFGDWDQILELLLGKTEVHANISECIGAGLVICHRAAR